MAMGNQQIKKVDFAIISAMPDEIAYINHIIIGGETVKTKIGDFRICDYSNKKILIAAIGMGTTCAAAMSSFIFATFQPDYLFFSGTAGGIDPRLKVGDVVIGTSAFEAEIQGAFTILPGTAFESALTHPVKNIPLQPRYSMDPCFAELVKTLTPAGLPNGVSIYQGAIVTTNTFPSPPSLFTEVRAQKPLAIDMETSAVYQTAWLFDKKTIVVRGISNLLNTDGEEDTAHETDVVGSAENSAKILLQVLDKVIHTLTPAPYVSEVAAKYIEQLSLVPHPEGGYFKQVFKSKMMISLSDGDDRYAEEPHSAGTSIYYLLAGNDFSAWHRIKSDEIWHYYDGSAMQIHVINGAGELITHILGNPMITAGASFQITITGDQWFAAEIIDRNTFSLVGCTVTPGFEFSDFELADRGTLISDFPKYTTILSRLTRVAATEDKEALTRWCQV